MVTDIPGAINYTIAVTYFHGLTMSKERFLLSAVMKFYFQELLFWMSSNNQHSTKQHSTAQPLQPNFARIVSLLLLLLVVPRFGSARLKSQLVAVAPGARRRPSRPSVAAVACGCRGGQPCACNDRTNSRSTRFSSARSMHFWSKSNKKAVDSRIPLHSL